ncbi:MAG: efflux RND transporter permease subunit, partial [Planctomycetes bacterium]|nr:efflux RND transporter permease subunit [Planctomycetota bacterium]
MAAPFDWDLGGFPRSPVPVDAIPDIGENQQIVFTEWMGRSPQDVEDQITYPLTVSLLGIPGVKSVRSYSYFGFSSIYIIFKDDIEFYWSRSRVLEKLNSLPADTLPPGVQPALGPDATALGQIFWYTLEGHDENGNPTGGWDLQELRSIQDWTVRYALLAAEGISEVASIGGFVKEYQVDVDPDAMRAYSVTLDEVYNAVRNSNIDVGARSIEVNRVEYFIRGLGFIRKLEDLENAVVKVNQNVPIYVRNVAHVALGAAPRRGALDKEGAEAVGGVAVVRYGSNPLAAIKKIKEKIEKIAPGLPAKAIIDFTKVTKAEIEAFAAEQDFEAFDGAALDQEAWTIWLEKHRDARPEWVKLSRVTIVPFYDRTGLIYETLGTLKTALTEEILVTIIVILVMVMHLRSSALIGALLPLAVLMCFIAMRTFHVDANIVALSGIAIAIGTMVDMGIIICENILKHLDEADPDENRLEVVYRAASEVGSAVLTAVATTVISFLPVFTMEAAEGKLFKPLAYTKTFALVSSLIVALAIIPPLAHILFTGKVRSKTLRRVFYAGLFAAGIAISIWASWWAGAIVALMAVYQVVEEWLPEHIAKLFHRSATWLAAIVIALVLTSHWLPLGPEKGMTRNFIFVGGLIGGLLLFFQIFQRIYEPLLRFCLNHKMLFLSLPAVIVFIGIGGVWLGFDFVFGWLPEPVKTLRPVSYIAHTFPGLGKEFMPPLDEGSYLFMPTTMTHASIGEALDVLQKQDVAMRGVPEVESVVGKLGRAETPLDPAPISMFETVVNYKPQYIIDRDGHRQSFRFEPDEIDYVRDKTGRPLPAPDGDPYRVMGRFEWDDEGTLIPDPNGMPFRMWRPPLDPKLNAGRKAWKGINKPDDIWAAILKATAMPGTTSAPRLQPIAARIVMLQSGMRAPMGVKVKGPDLETIEKVGLQIEKFLKSVPSVEPAAVVADRIVGKPYLEIDFNREEIARYGLTIRRVQVAVEVAIGGKRLTTTVEGLERYPVRVRYPRELRDSIESLGKILISTPSGVQIPITQLAEIKYVRGPQVIKSEDTRLVGYVTFDKRPGHGEVDVVEDCKRYLKAKIASKEFIVPYGVDYEFAGSYENQVRAEKKLLIVLPLALFIIFIILYLQFRSVPTSLLVFVGIGVAWAGGFIMIWLYGQPWFLDFSVFGTDMRELFQVHPIILSTAIWVGFLALFGIASDDGVVIATYLDESFARRKTTTVAQIREATVAAGKRRVRPCLMTTATTVLALIPVLTSTGRGADIMVPMAIPSFGGMMFEVITMLVVPVLYCLVKELKLKFGVKDVHFEQGEDQSPA